MFDQQSSGFNFGDIQDIVDDSQQMAAGTLDFEQIIALPAAQFGFQKQMRQSGDGMHRCPYFMTHIGQKIGFHLRCGLCGLLGFLHEFFSVLSFADIAGDTQVSGNAARFVTQCRYCQQNGDVLSALADIGPFRGVRFSRPKRMGEHFETRVDAKLGGPGIDFVGNMEHGRCLDADQFFCGIAGQLLRFGVETDDQAPDVRGNHCCTCTFDNRSLQSGCFPQLVAKPGFAVDLKSQRFTLRHQCFLGFGSAGDVRQQ